MVGARPFFIEDVTEHRGAAFCPKFRQDILNAGNAAEALCFQHGAKIPVIHRRIHFTAESFRREQRRRAVYDRRL